MIKNSDNNKEYVKNLKNRFMLNDVNDYENDTGYNIEDAIIYFKNFITYLKVNKIDSKYLMDNVDSVIADHLLIVIRNYRFSREIKERKDSGLRLFCESCGEMSPNHYSGCKLING